MFALILKATHNTAFKDVASIVRGIYRVSEGFQVRRQSQTRTSWMDEPKQQTPSQIVHQSVPQSLKHQKTFEIKTESQPPNMQQQNNSKRLQADTKIGQQAQTDKIQRFETKKEKVYLQGFKQIPQIPSFIVPEINKVPSSRISRIFQFGKLGISLASATIFSQGKSEEHYKDLAERVSEQLCKMRGAPLKLAQMLSIQEEGLIPTPIRRAFEKARESAHVIPADEVDLMLKKNLGENWRLLFKQFSQSPFASASIGQVHRATLLNGEKVAIKVQYNGVRESIESDIQNLGMLMKIPGLFPKGIFIQRILKNTKQQLMQECDYQLEKQYQETYQKCMKKSLGEESELFKIAEIYSKYSTKEVLTSTYITGIKIKDIEHDDYPQSIKNQIGRRLMKLTFKELFEMGIMQSDPNPSNFTYNPNQDVLNLYDFGATHVYKPEFLKNYYDIIRGSVLEDEDLIWEASIKTGFVTGEENTAMRNSHIESILILGEPLRHKGSYDFGVQEITKRMYETIPLMLKNRLKSPPQEIYSLHRKLSGTYLACIRLKAKVDCSEIFREIKFQTIASSGKLD